MRKVVTASNSLKRACSGSMTGGVGRSGNWSLTSLTISAMSAALLELDNVVLTPHIGSLTEEGVRRMSMESVRNCLDGIDGKLRPEYVVNKEVLGHSTNDP